MDALLLGLGDGLVDDGVDGVGVHGVLLGDGVGHQDAPVEAQVVLGLQDLGQHLGAVHLVVHLQAGGPGVEGGELLGLVAQDGDPLGLQVFQGELQVQDGLGPGADHHHVGLAQLLQVGGDVHGGLRPPVDPSDAPGGEEFDPRHVGDHHGGGHGGGPVGPLGHQDGQVPAGGLGDLLPLLAQVLNLRRGEAGLQPPPQDGDGGGDSPVLADDLFHFQSGLHILGVGHAVGDDGGLQGHHRLAFRQGLGHGGVHVKIGIHSASSCSVIRAWTASADRAGLMVFSPSTAMAAAALAARAL